MATAERQRNGGNQALDAVHGVDTVQSVQWLSIFVGRAYGALRRS